MDDGKKSAGNILLEFCIGNDLFIVNGRIGDDCVEYGKLTYINLLLLIIIFVCHVFF